MLRDKLLSVDSLSDMGISRHGSCSSLLLRARTGALLSEKQAGSAPGWMQLPRQMLELVSRPQGLIRAFPPAQALPPAFGKWGDGGWMVFAQLATSSQPVREVLFLVLEITSCLGFSF